MDYRSFIMAAQISVPRTLIADDQPDVLEALRLLLKSEGYQIEAVTSPAAVIDALKKRDYDVLLMDLNYARDTTSGQEGLDLLSRVQEIDNSLPVVVMTAWGSIELAVEAMRRGVRDFVLKPWENSRLLAILRAQIENGHVERMTRQLRAEQDHDLVEAREIQRGLLPKRIPQIAGFDISCAWQPARAVSGDYYDVLELGAGKLALCIADVSGKGLPAALLMSNVQAAVKAFAAETTRPAEVCSKVNRVVSSNTSQDKFITLFYATIDAESSKLTYTSAGHNTGIVVRRNGEVERLYRGGLVLGPFPECEFDEGETVLDLGDRVVLFTDGVTEAVDEDGDEFGEERLIKLVLDNRHLPAASLERVIMGAVARFSGEQFHDDATLIVLSAD
jgi:sigma-B regulation protein RsbU (phosphoserine phosphatase)